MKIRNGFVSNSSSSSFVVPLRVVTPMQLEQIYNHIEVDQELKLGCSCEIESLNNAWDISINKYMQTLTVSTSMDNFDMGKFLWGIGVSPDFTTGGKESY